MRASGLAARNIALNENNSESCSLLTNSQLAEQHAAKNNASETKVWEEIDQVHDSGRYDDEVKGFRKGNKCKIGCSTVRKLFTEDSLVENDALPCNSNNTAGEQVLQLPNCDDGLAGLSYIDSQEPGEFSQANALECVQRLIDESKVLFDDEIDQGKSSRGKSNCISTVKGPQSMAKKTNDRGANGKTGIFDWDDGREDEGGGDIFRRRKEEFFGRENLGQRSFRKPQKPRGKRSGGGRDNEGQPNVQNELMFHSDSRMILCNLKVGDKAREDTEMNIRKNLVNEFDEQANVDESTGQLEATMTKKDEAESLNVGLDTQMAAEAMEVLLYGEGVANCDANDAHPSPLVNPKQTRKSTNNVDSKQCSFDNRYDAGVTTRQSKRTKRIISKSSKQSSVSSQKHSENVRKECDTDLAMTRRKRAKSGAEELLTASEGKIMKEMSSQIVEPRDAKGAVEGNEPDVFGRCHGTSINRGRSVKKQHLKEELATFTPIARRTRQSLEVSRLTSAEHVLDCVEEANCPMEVGALEQNGAGTVGVEASKVLNANRKSAEWGSNQCGGVENFIPKLTAMSNCISCPKGRRSRRNLSVQHNEPHNFDAQSKPSGELGNIGKSVNAHKRLQNNSRITTTDLNIKRKTRSSISSHLDSSFVYQNVEKLSPQTLDKAGLGDSARNCNSVDMNNNNMSKDLMGEKAVKLSDRKGDADSSPTSENRVNISADKSPMGTTKSSELACTSPADCMTPVNAASPVCMGNGYFKQSCKRNLSRSCLRKEISRLCAMQPEAISVPKDSRKRRDLANIRVLFSNHLDEDIIKQQRKVNLLDFMSPLS